MTKVYRKRQGEEARRDYSRLLTERSPSRDLDKPTVVDAIPGDPDGLLPEDKAHFPIRIEIEEFDLEPPGGSPIEFKSYLTLEWKRENEFEFYPVHDVVELSNKVAVQWPLELSIDTEHFPIPEDKFIFRYNVILWNSNNEDSEEVPIRIDKVAPYADRPDPDDNPPKIRFTSAYITDDTLAAEDGVECLIDDFTDVDRDRIRVAVGLGAAPPDPDEVIIPAFFGPLPDDGKVTIPRSYIDNLKSGTYYVTYTLIDPAGNISKLSRVNSISMALGALPTNLKLHSVPLHADGLINRADAAKVRVEVPLYDNHDPNDQIVVEWGAVLVPPTPVGEVPSDPISIPVSWPRLKAEYDFVAGGEQIVEVGYRVERAPQVEFRPDPETIDINVDFSMTGPIDPTDPDPNPVTPLLEKVSVISDSGVVNKLSDVDFNQPATARFGAPYPTVAGDTFTLYWNGVAVADTYVADGSERPGTVISITITWDEIFDGGMHPELPVMYVMSHGSFPNNDRESVTTHVAVSVIPIVPEAPIFPDYVPAFLNCGALRTVNGVIGYRVKVPPSSYLVPGEKIEMRWRVFDSDEATPIPAVDKDEELTIPDDAQTNGIDWFVEYDQHILPTDAASANRFTFADIDYTVPVEGTGRPSLKTHQIMSISLATPGATCELTSIPTP